MNLDRIRGAARLRGKIPAEEWVEMYGEDLINGYLSSMDSTSHDNRAPKNRSFRAWADVLDALYEFECAMGGGNQRNGRELLTRTPPYMKPTKIRMMHLRAFYLAIRLAARSYGEEMAQPDPLQVSEDHLEKLSALLEKAAASPLKPGATEEEKATVAKCFGSLQSSVSRLQSSVERFNPCRPKGV